VVVFEWATGSKPDENLACLDSDGHVKWTAKLPMGQPGDCYVAVALEDDLIRASSMSGYAIWLDPRTGNVLRTQFTK
jgi:outer membrane protein assembly factor BamB